MRNKNRLKTIFFRWGPVLIWMAVIFLFSNRPTLKASAFDPLDFIVKKTAHLSEYAILFGLVFRALYLTLYKKILAEKVENLAIFVTLVYAISDEFHQRFISGRTASVRDVFIDFIGIMVGLIVVKWIRTQHKQKTLKIFFYGH